MFYNQVTPSRSNMSPTDKYTQFAMIYLSYSEIKHTMNLMYDGRGVTGKAIDYVKKLVERKAHLMYDALDNSPEAKKMINDLPKVDWNEVVENLFYMHGEQK